MGVLFCAGASRAQDGRLTEEMIEDFYHRSALIFKESAAEYLDFLDRHLHDDLQASFTSVTKMTGAQAHKENMRLDKDEVIAQALKDYAKMHDADVENTVLSVRISSDGHEAFVRDTGYMKTRISVPTAQGEMFFHLESQGFCNDRLVLNDGRIQLLQSKCAIDNTLRRWNL